MNRYIVICRYKAANNEGYIVDSSFNKMIMASSEKEAVEKFLEDESWYLERNRYFRESAELSIFLVSNEYFYMNEDLKEQIKSAILNYKKKKILEDMERAKRDAEDRVKHLENQMKELG